MTANGECWCHLRTSTRCDHLTPRSTRLGTRWLSGSMRAAGPETYRSRGHCPVGFGWRGRALPIGPDVAVGTIIAENQLAMFAMAGAAEFPQFRPIIMGGALQCSFV